MEQRPFFVYGTLKRGESNYESFLGGRTSDEQPATLSGAALYTEGPYPYLVMEPDLAAPLEQVQGTLVIVRPDCYSEVLAQVDRLEDYIPGDDHNEYERVIRTVQTSSGPVDAFTYVAATRTLAAIRAGGHFSRIEGGVWNAARPPQT